MGFGVRQQRGEGFKHGRHSCDLSWPLLTQLRHAPLFHREPFAADHARTKMIVPRDGHKLAPLSTNESD